MVKVSDLLLKQIKERYRYDPDTGEIFRRIKTVKWDGRKGTMVASNLACWGVYFQVTHLMYFLQTGIWPGDGDVIDHIDRDGSNMKWSNLRLTDSSGNNQNRTAKKANPGVYRKPNGKYQVNVNGVHIGVFSTLREADNAARRARRIIQGEFAHDARVFRRRV